MSDGKEHILLLGDTHEAAKWVGFGKARLRLLRATNQLARNYKPKPDVLVRVERWGDVEKVIIRVQPPPGPAFVGLPYDTFAFDGYGFEEDREPDTAIGTAQVQENRATLIKTGSEGAWMVERYPQYVGDYGGEPEYGNNVWRSSAGAGAITLSWKGLQSRHPQVLLANEELYAGFNCQDFGFAYIGMQLTDGLYCSGSQVNWFKTIPYTSVALPSGSSNAIDGGNVLIDLFGQYVYRDGHRFFNAGSNQTIMGAAIRTDSLTGEKQFLCVIGQRDRDIGIYKEELYYAPLNDIKNGKKALIAEYNNDRYTSDSGPYFVRPETNGMSWNFSESGQFAVTMRQFYNYEDGYFEVVACKMDPDSVIYNRGTDLYEVEQLWNSHFAAPAVTSTNNAQDFAGEYVITVDVDGEDIVYAYVDMVFDRIAYYESTDVLISEQFVSEYLRFSKFPDEAPIFLHKIQTDIRWENDSTGRDYCYKDFWSPTNVASVIGCIDARYGVATFWQQQEGEYRIHRKGTSPNLVFETSVLPLPVRNAETVHTYVAGKLLESKPTLYWDDSNYGGPFEEVLCPKDNITVVYAYSPFITADDRAHPFVFNFFGHYASSVVAANISETYADIVISFKAYNNGFASPNYILRMDRITGQIIARRDLNELLQLDTYNPYYPPDEGPQVPDEGTYGYVGLI